MNKIWEIGLLKLRWIRINEFKFTKNSRIKLIYFADIFKRCHNFFFFSLLKLFNDNDRRAWNTFIVFLILLFLIGRISIELLSFLFPCCAISSHLSLVWRVENLGFLFALFNLRNYLITSYHFSWSIPNQKDISLSIFEFSNQVSLSLPSLKYLSWNLLNFKLRSSRSFQFLFLLLNILNYLMNYFSFCILSSLFN